MTWGEGCSSARRGRLFLTARTDAALLRNEKKVGAEEDFLGPERGEVRALGLFLEKEAGPLPVAGLEVDCVSAVEYCSRRSSNCCPRGGEPLLIPWNSERQAGQPVKRCRTTLLFSSRESWAERKRWAASSVRCITIVSWARSG